MDELRRSMRTISNSDSSWVSLVTLSLAVAAVAISTARQGSATPQSLGTSLFIAGTFVALWGARACVSQRRGVRDRNVGYGVAALIAILAAPSLLPVAAYHFGFLTFVGATYIVLGWRSRQQVTWLAGVAVLLLGALTGSAVIRSSALSIRESVQSSTVSASIQGGLAAALLAIAAFTALNRRIRQHEGLRIHGG